jgi:hypothetical protein
MRRRTRHPRRSLSRLLNKNIRTYGQWAIIVLACALFAWNVLTQSPPPSDSDAAIALDQKAIEHILHGDGRGGGHLYGTGTPCKSEFPANWGQDKILETTRRIAANDNLNWKNQENGYRVAEDFLEGVKVRVVVDGARNRIVTSYPTNVRRNPCPANDR